VSVWLEENLGIDLNSAQLLIRAHRSGVSFGRMATLGRQRILGDRESWISILRGSGYEVSKDCCGGLLDPATPYSEDFFRLLGAKEIAVVDMSDYEGAQIVHDMNRPIPDALVSSFDLVLDGGTLEHIFDLPTALRNATRMVRPGGRFISLTMANNFCGHGFYQFSPELFYRFLCPQNGYTIEACVVWEDIPQSRFYRVPDPDAVQDRINITSEVGTYMFIQAKRLDAVVREFTPQQSDYVRQWGQLGESALSSGASQQSSTLSKLRSVLKRIPILRSAVVSGRKLPPIAAYRAMGEYRRLQIKRNTKGFLTPLEDLQVLR